MPCVVRASELCFICWSNLIFLFWSCDAKIFKGSAFVFHRKSCLLKIKCLLILAKKYLVQELFSEKGGGCFLEHVCVVNYGSGQVQVDFSFNNKKN